jgi:hypothetical protein
MTGAEFTARYRLREQINDGSVSTFRAIDGRGSKVFVHVFRDTSASDFDPATLDAAGAALVREVLDVEAIKVVVTGEIEPFSTFEAWTADRQRKEAGEPGAYTRIFRVDTPEPAPQPDTPPVTTPDPVAPHGANRRNDVRPQPVDAGEYTRLFGVASEVSPPLPPPPPPYSAAPPPPPAPSEHSTYSRIMRPDMPMPPSSGASPGYPPGPAPRLPQSPTDSSRYPTTPTPPPPPTSRPEAQPPTSSTGAYTMVMRTGGAPQEPPPPPRQTASPPRARETLDSDLYADNYLHRLRVSAPEVTPHNVPVPIEPPRLDRSLYEPPAPEEPGSYTMIIGKGAHPAKPLTGLEPQFGYPAPPPPPAPSSPPPAKAKSKTPLIVMLVLVVAVLIALILFLALRPTS